MNTREAHHFQASYSVTQNNLTCVATFITLLGVAASCLGQGTMTVGFEVGVPRGTRSGLGDGYVDQQTGLQFAGAVFDFSGGGITNCPDNGTGYLEIPTDTTLRIGYNLSSFPIVPFNLVSFDAAEYDSLGPVTLTVVGYKPMDGTVTNSFTVGSEFQTFYFDSSFSGVYEVDVLHANWSLDNVVISGIPEPSPGALLLLGALSFAGYRGIRRKQRQSAVPLEATGSPQIE